MENQDSKNVILVAFYNIKALGVRYLETALAKKGYHVTTVFFKNFNSVHPCPTNDEEVRLLGNLVEQKKPLFVGYSVMSSMYLDTVDRLIEGVHERFPGVTTVAGGAFATMFPEKMLERGIDFVIRSDGEIPLVKLADALGSGEDWSGNPSLCFMKDGKPQVNPIGDLLEDIDGYGLPAIECMDAYYIENSACVPGDPQLSTMSYEVIASRGCPFTCTYCCCENLRRLLPKGVSGVRSRSVESVMTELVQVKKKFKKLVFVHFYDEIFPNTPGWVKDFAARYKEKINLPFTIWSHPKMVSDEELKLLVDAGLSEVIMGVQSGSDHIRRDIFHRYETNDDVVEATRRIKDAKVFWGTYDFMLQHPFESIDDLKATYFLVKRMHGPFELQLHGLNFLPGTDIIEIAVEQGVATREELEKIMFAPMDKQFETFWQQKNSELSDLWYRMIFCLQFPSLAKKVEAFEEDPAAHRDEINALYARGKQLARRRYLWKKGNMVLRRMGIRLK